MDELPEQARTSPPRLAHHGHDLPVTPCRLVESLAEMDELLAAPHEAGEASCGCRLKARARRRWPRQLEDIDRGRQPLDRDRADRDDLDEPLGEPQRLAGQPRRARGRELLHARGEVRGLTHRRVIHAQMLPIVRTTTSPELRPTRTCTSIPWSRRTSAV